MILSKPLHFEPLPKIKRRALRNTAPCPDKLIGCQSLFQNKCCNCRNVLKCKLFYYKRCRGDFCEWAFKIPNEILAIILAEKKNENHI